MAFCFTRYIILSEVTRVHAYMNNSDSSLLFSFIFKLVYASGTPEPSSFTCFKHLLFAYWSYCYDIVWNHVLYTNLRVCMCVCINNSCVSWLNIKYFRCPWGTFLATCPWMNYFACRCSCYGIIWNQMLYLYVFTCMRSRVYAWKVACMCLWISHPSISCWTFAIDYARNAPMPSIFACIPTNILHIFWNKRLFLWVGTRSLALLCLCSHPSVWYDMKYNLIFITTQKKGEILYITA